MTTQVKELAPETDGASAWERVRSRLRADYLARSTPERLQALGRLIDEASVDGRRAEDPVREVLGLIGDRWSTLLLQLLHHGPFRYTELQRIISDIDDVGISNRMLTYKLRALERDGFVSRCTAQPEPIHVEYMLTADGEQLWALAASLVDWLSQHVVSINQARVKFDEIRPESGPT